MWKISSPKNSFEHWNANLSDATAVNEDFKDSKLRQTDCYFSGINQNVCQLTWKKIKKIIKSNSFLKLFFVSYGVSEISYLQYLSSWSSCWDGGINRTIKPHCLAIQIIFTAF